MFNIVWFKIYQLINQYISKIGSDKTVVSGCFYTILLVNKENYKKKWNGKIYQHQELLPKYIIKYCCDKFFPLIAMKELSCCTEFKIKKLK